MIKLVYQEGNEEPVGYFFTDPFDLVGNYNELKNSNDPQLKKLLLKMAEGSALARPYNTKEAEND